ncbi:hypothetical protein ACVME8_006616 [Bradyrhizobium diazoefficiens]
MAIDRAQSLKPDEDRTKVAPESARDVHPQSSFDFPETGTRADDGSNYLPGKWSWGPARSSFDW